MEKLARDRLGNGTSASAGSGHMNTQAARRLKPAIHAAAQAAIAAKANHAAAAR